MLLFRFGRLFGSGLTARARSASRLLYFGFFLACLGPDLAFAACQQDLGAASSRFLVTDGEAFDSQTGLIWQRCSVGMTWHDDGCGGERALMSLNGAVKAAERAGSGWRVPTIKELYSIVDTTCGTPTIDMRVFPDIRVEEENRYWTTSEVGLAGLVYYVDLATGDSDAHSRGFSLAVRLVRSRP